ncbi:MAG: helix-turn-helix domain-containing protein [Flavobacterium sp.]|uniref:GlxA family transcriptional regulator n=1 Tax=Flavobacterium sp. TaxID=239 RepID=UPI001210F0CF|nr:helix-turn-helix domain-containing protein [Flavobacterium sp.]RZJ67227.1 MAG: helix-turn-helix domain-containing protein [Flavobacterium sp.]
MKHLTIVVPNGKGNNLSSIVGAYKLFARANAFFKDSGKAEVFSIDVAGIAPQVDYYDGLFSVNPHKNVSDIASTDLIIVPSLNHDYENSVRQNTELTNWIAKQYKNGTEVATICTGAFLLAESGLLDSKSCSTHWAAADNFRTRFPKVKLQPDQLITDEKGIYTNGGAYSFLNLMLYLIEKYYDRPTAVFLSKVFQIEMDRKNQSGFIIFKGQKQHADEEIKQAQTFIENNLQHKISIEELSSRFSITRRNFDRRFIKATGNTPIEYAQRVRIESAKRSLETSRKTVSEVMFDVGYADEKAFREVFRRITGFSPIEYKTRYNSRH